MNQIELKISEAIKKECLKKDKNSKANVMVGIKPAKIYLVGGVLCKSYINFEKIVWDVLWNLSSDKFIKIENKLSWPNLGADRIVIREKDKIKIIESIFETGSHEPIYHGKHEIDLK